MKQDQNMAKDFTFLDENHEEKTIHFQADDFALVHENKVLSDTKMMSKPTTFFKDALRRFAKNKSSVVGAIILGILILLSIILPEALPYDIKSDHPYEKQLAPKLFETGTGWWDGTKGFSHIAMDIDWDKYDETGVLEGLPSNTLEKDIVNGRKGISMGKVGDEFTNDVSAYAHGGYVRLSHMASRGENKSELSSWTGVTFDFRTDNGYVWTLETANANTFSTWTYGDQAPYSFYFVWNDLFDATITYEVPLAANISTYGTFVYNLSADYTAAIKTAVGWASSSDDYKLYIIGSQKPHFMMRLETTGKETATNNVLLKTAIFTTTNANQTAAMKNLSCYDANTALSIPATDSSGKTYDYYWAATQGNLNLYHADIIYGNYRIDTYEQNLGSFTNANISLVNLKGWRDKGWLTGDFSKIDDYASYTDATERKAMIDAFCASLQPTEAGKIHMPLTLDADHVVTGAISSGGGFVALSFSGTCIRWKLLYPNLSSCPKYLLGTDNSGRDMLKYAFSGLRTSLLLGFITFIVCFIFGLIWGAISGYFGGWVDILMERFIEILSGIPWIVIMTLAIILYGSNFTVFVLALCLTGWIGTASITRTQFYRFKDREYILAARTLGASDMRLIFRHVLPNAVGTIITSSVLMIPSVIFSEASLAYLNLGLKGLDSFGVMLSANQQYVSTNPILIVFPSIVMALMMVSFNLFGNGLRDAFNPSLKGEE